MTESLVAIHQPNFFPWLGYFDKIAGADVFVFLDDVQFPKTGGVWSNRVKLLISGEARWVTAAIDRSYSGVRKINEMHFLNTNPWRQKLLKTIEASYKKHPFYDEAMNVFGPLIENPESNIAEYNMYAVTEIASAIGLEIPMSVRASSIASEATSNELLCELTLAVGGDTYICGGGADGYQDETVFKKNSVTLNYQNFKHPQYRQHKRDDFISGLSIMDVVMNIGWESMIDLFIANSCEL